MDHNDTPINGESPHPETAENALWRVGDGAKAVFEVVRWPFEQVGWALQRALVWPAQDRFEGLDGRGRGLFAGGGLAVIAVGVTGLVLATSGGSSSSWPAAPTASVAQTAPAPIVKAAPEPKPEPREPTLHGAEPTFKPAKQAPGSAKVDAAKPVQSPSFQPADQGSTPSSPSSSSSSAATSKISSDPSATAATSSADAGTAETSAVDGRPAGKAAIAVARKFSNAFVIFETGGDETTVRKAFAASATPTLSKSLLKRPPRLPANVKVPQAKVLNIVAGPSHAGIYNLSVSLLRVGVTSELRLEMEKLKGEGWRVTNVLG